MKYMHLISRERDPWKVEGRYKQNLRPCLLLPSRALFGTGRGNSEVCIVFIFLIQSVGKFLPLQPTKGVQVSNIYTNIYLSCVPLDLNVCDFSEI